jgi:hypothetical protein
MMQERVEACRGDDGIAALWRLTKSPLRAGASAQDFSPDDGR